MKIGIMSMQRIKNYGSFLQAFSLKKTLEELGAEVEFIDYRVEPPKVVKVCNNVEEEKISTLKRISMIPFKAVNINYWRRRIEANKKRKLDEERTRKLNDIAHSFNERFKEFLLDLNVTSERKYDTSDLDMLVIGSDEVFNCLQTNPDVGYSKDLFGNNSKAKRLISYAASFGHTTIEQLEEYDCKDEVADMLKKFNDISVRDKNSGEIIKQLVNVEPNYNVDPVFLYDFSDYIKDIEVKLDNYIVVYAYSCRIKPNEQVEIKKFAEKYNKKLVSIGTIQRFCDINIVLSPFELLAYIKNADFIITDTFHGSVFSIKYNKKFATIIRESNKQKLGDLLERFGVDDRRVENIEDLESIINQDINYDEINKLIYRKIAESKLYLEKNIKSITE